MFGWLFVGLGVRVGSLDSGGLDSGGERKWRVTSSGEALEQNHIKAQAVGEEEWKATSSVEALEQSHIKLQVKRNGKLLPRAKPSDKANSSCRQRGMESYFLGRSPRIRPSQAAKNRRAFRAPWKRRASREHIVLCGQPNSRHPRTVRILSRLHVVLWWRVHLEEMVAND